MFAPRLALPISPSRRINGRCPRFSVPVSTVSIGMPFPKKIPNPIKKPKNMAKEALKVKSFLD